MSDLTSLIDDHLAAYGDPDPARRRAAVQRLWADDGRLIDPPLAARGHDEIDAQAGALQSQFPGHRFVRSTGIDAHHGVARYGWTLLDPAGAPVLDGMDFAEVDADGRLVRIAGFFGALPAAAAPA